MRKSSSRKRQKEEILPVDRFSNLPDLVLSHILSYLPTTKEVVATSILSKRWKSLWTLVDTLNFDNMREVEELPGKMTFAQFVYRVLQFNKVSIKNMRLSCSCSQVNEYDARNWIGTAIDRGVECLDLNLFKFEFRWPFSLFRSNTLVEMNLLNVDICNLEIPASPFFPSLKKLYIEPAQFEAESLERLISGCSALEHLIVKLTCYKISFNISCSTLKKLEWYGGGYLQNKILLDVPALEFLKMVSQRAELVLEDQLYSLVEVDICFVDVGSFADDHYRNSFERFLQLISNVKVMRLNCCFTKNLTIPMKAKFHNLTKLKIMSPFYEWTLVRSSMESSINLQSITLEQKYPEKAGQVLWSDPQDVPHCLLSSLRDISITGYGLEYELDMLRYVLRNAEVLERMDIHCFGHQDDYKLKFHMLQRMVMIKRSSRCQISFE